jgi:hypothetical protein
MWDRNALNMRVRLEGLYGDGVLVSTDILWLSAERGSKLPGRESDISENAFRTQFQTQIESSEIESVERD